MSAERFFFIVRERAGFPHFPFIVPQTVFQLSYREQNWFAYYYCNNIPAVFTHVTVLFSMPVYLWTLISPERVPRNAVSTPSAMLPQKERDITVCLLSMQQQRLTPMRWAWAQSSRLPWELWPQHQKEFAAATPHHLLRKTKGKAHTRHFWFREVQ